MTFEVNWGEISTGWESSDAFQKKGEPQALANPRKSRLKSNNYLPTKKISEKVKSVFSVKSVFKFLSIAAGLWTLYYHRYNYSVLPLCPWPSAGPQIKKWNTDSTDFTRIGLFTDSFFDDIELMILGFCFGFSRICKCLGTSFLVYDRVMYSIECYYMLFRKKGVPQALANPRKSKIKSKI